MKETKIELMQKIENRISILLKTDTAKAEFNNMCRLQMEHSPHLTQNEAEDYVILGLVKIYNDRELDHLWFQYTGADTQKEKQVA